MHHHEEQTVAALQAGKHVLYDSFAEELADFCRRVEGKEVPLADGDSGLRAAEIANAVYESSSRGVPIGCETSFLNAGSKK